MKKLERKFICYLLIVGGIIVLGTPLIGELIIGNNDPSAIFVVFWVMVLIIIVGAVIIGVGHIRCIEKYLNEKIAEAKRELTEEYKTVFIITPSDIPRKKVKCQAKVNEDGKITCKVQCDFETTLDSHEEFLRYFKLTDDDD